MPAAQLGNCLPACVAPRCLRLLPCCCHAAAARRRYEESSTFFSQYYDTTMTLMAKEVAIINANGTCSAYTAARRNRKSISGDLYFQMCVDARAHPDLEPKYALTGGLLGLSNAATYLDKLHKVGGQPAASKAVVVESAQAVPGWLAGPDSLRQLGC
jgi:hypothetical protein